jgi:predicted Rossmann-fold nucleotide-binding protein
MADMQPDLVVAFPGGAGTAMMVDIAKNRQIPVIIVPEE